MAVTRTQTLYITPDDDAQSALIAAATSATVSLHVLCYGFTDPALAGVLIAKHAAGLRVGVVTDKTQAAGPTQHALLLALVKAGVPVTITTSPKSKINHEKALIVDAALGYTANESLVAFGSYNFSTGAEDQNNHLLISNDPSLVERFWLKYGDADAFGRAHPQWQTPLSVAPEPAPAPEPTPAA